MSGAFTTNGVWEAQFFGHSNWLYTLERTTNFGSWTSISPAVQGTGGNMILEDTNTVAARAFYRVRVQ